MALVQIGTSASFTADPINYQIDVDSYLYWVSPLNLSHIVAGEPQAMLVDAASTVAASLNIAIFEDVDNLVYLTSAVANTSNTFTVSSSYPRGPAQLAANTTESYFYPNATIEIFVNTTVSFASPLNNSNYAQNTFIPVQLVAADSQSVEGTVEMSCDNGFSVSHVVNSTISTDFISENSGNCTFLIISLNDPYAIAASDSDIIVQVLNSTSITAPASMTVGVASTVYVNTTLQTTTDTFEMTFTCGANQQNFTGTYNVPLSVTLNNNMGPYTACVLSIPETELEESATASTNVYAALTFTTVTPDPVIAGSDLTIYVNATDDSSELITVTLTCYDSSESIQINANTDAEFPVPSYFNGSCSLTTAPVNNANLYVQVGAQNVDVDSYLYWVSPLNLSHVVAGEPQAMLVDAASTVAANLDISIFEDVDNLIYLTSAVANTSNTFAVSSSYPRGPAQLAANTTESYFYPNATIQIFVNTTVSFASPLNNSNYAQNTSIPVQLVAADSQSVEGTVEMSCDNGFSVSHVVNSTLSTDFVSENSGNCTFSIISLDQYAIAASDSDIIVQVLNYTTITAPASMTVGVASTVYVNTTLQTTADTFILTFTCGANQQNFTGTYNVPLSVTLNDDMGPNAGCTLSIPETELEESASTTTDVYAALSFTTVTPNPVIAGSNLTLYVNSSDAYAEPITITLTCFDSSETIETTAEVSVEFPVPSFFNGSCSLSVASLNLYAQVGTQNVNVNSSLLWISPLNYSYIVAGQSESMLVDAASTVPASLEISIFEDVDNLIYLTSAVANTSNTFTVSSSYPRGPAQLVANTTESYFYPNATIEIFVNTTVSFASPLNNSNYVQNSSIPVQLLAADSQAVEGTVEMSCDNGYSVSHVVNSTLSTDFVSENSGNCTFSIISLDQYAIASSDSDIIVQVLNYTTITAPASMTVGVASTVYVNSTLNVATDTFYLTFTCGANQQNFTGTYNVPLSVTLNDNMGPNAGCTLSIPETELAEGASTTTNVYAALSFTTVTPDPVIAGSNLTLYVNSSDAYAEPITITLTCFDSSETIETTAEVSVEFPVPSFFNGSCSLSVASLNLYAQVGTQDVDVDSYLFWVSPLNYSYIVAGQPESMLVDAASTVPASLKISIFEDVDNLIYLTDAVANTSTTFTVSSSYPRGPAQLAANTTESYFYPNATIEIFVNTTVSFASPLNNANYVQNSSIPVQLVAADSQSAEGTVEMPCTNGFSVSHVVNNTLPTDFLSENSGECTFSLINVVNDYAVVATGSDVTVQVLNFTFIIAPESMVVGVPATVYVNTTLQEHSDPFNLTFTCGSTTQYYSGTFNVPLTVTPSVPMGPFEDCTLSIPQTELEDSAYANTNVNATLTFTTVTPTPVTAGSNITFNLVASDSASVPVIVDLTCGDLIYSMETNSSDSDLITLPVPTYFIGICSLTTIPVNTSALYTQVTAQSVTVNSFLTWIIPEVSEYLLAGSNQDILVNSSSIQTADLDIYLGVGTSIGSATSNQTASLLIPAGFSRGPVNLIASTSEQFFITPATLSVIVNTTVTFASPVNGGSYPQNSVIPVQLVAADGQSVSGSVQMNCTGGYSIVQTVQSASSTFFVSPVSGSCSFTILSVSNDYAVAAAGSAIETSIYPFVNPFSGPVYPLTPQQASAFAVSVSFPVSSGTNGPAGPGGPANNNNNNNGDNPFL